MPMMQVGRPHLRYLSLARVWECSGASLVQLGATKEAAYQNWAAALAACRSPRRNAIERRRRR